MSGPVSQVLEQEVLAEVRRQGIVVWLDKDAAYTRFVDRLTERQASGEIPFPVAGFRGSFLELLFALEPYGSDLDRKPLLIHMPGFNEETIRKTPVLELYAAGVRFRKSLDTLIREAATARVTPEEVERFLAKQPTLEEADAWLETSVSQSTFGLAAALAEYGPQLVTEALADPASLAPRVTAPAEAKILADYLHKLTGMDGAWIEPFRTDPAKQLAPLLEALKAWILCVEYTHDLKRDPHRPDLLRLRGLSAQLVKSNRDLVAALRRNHADAYERMAREVSDLVRDELEAMTPEDLGQIDTFREEEQSVLEGAIEALRQKDWPKAKSWWEERQGEKSFWLQRDAGHRWAWTLVGEATRFRETLARHAEPFAGARSLEQAVDLYAAGGWEVDRAHRRFEQTRLALLEPSLPHYGALREIATGLRQDQRDWMDRLTRSFAGLCQEHGFLPPAALQQRNLFEQAVLPLFHGGEKVALFVIDAFRYEMAAELAEELAGGGTVVDLKPRLAELPTITAVGMNALAPVAVAGRLTVAGVFKGFRTNELIVQSPEDRVRAMGQRTPGRSALYLKLAEVAEKTTAELTRKIKPHQLVVVHSREIDDAGEANVGLPTFEATLRQIKAAWHHLQLAGVKTAVFTADHGFLLQDETGKDLERDFGKKTVPQRRYVLDEYPRAEKGMIPVSTASLGYEGISGYLLFLDDTRVYKTVTTGGTYVHGGLSPQERIIPVLTIARKHREQAVHAAYDIEVQPLSAVMGHHRLKLRVVNAPGTLAFAAPQRIELAVRVPKREDVHVILKDVAGSGKIRAGRLQVPVGEEWTEVFFGLEGPADERVRLEIYHADHIQNVRGTQPETWYLVSGTTSSPPPETPEPSGWTDAIPDEGIRKVFLHLEKHGAITETEVTHLLGSPRAFRRFSLEFDEHLPKLPFGVRIETGDSGKRYVREDNR